MRGHHYEPIDQYLKDRYLELISDGYTPYEAARMLNQTSSRFRRHRNPDSASYDQEFTETYDRLTQPGGQHEQHLVERLEGAAIERAVDKSDKLLLSALIVKHDGWKLLRPQAQNQTINIEELQVLLPQVSNETLARMIHEVQERKALPPAHPDIEAA